MREIPSLFHIISDEGFTYAIPEGKRPIACKADFKISNAAADRADITAGRIEVIERQLQTLIFTRNNIAMVMLRQDNR